MNLIFLSRHKTLSAFSIAIVLTAILLCFVNGELNEFSAISWVDIAGEGCIAIFTLMWIFGVLMSRPSGRVTTLLVVGLSCFSFSALLDVFDEFILYADAANWLTIVESIPAGIGMIIMSLALYLWHHEQLALNRQLHRRELWNRSHEQIDTITQLYRADYWRARALELQEKSVPASIIILDINNFSQFNQRYGHQEGDRFLREIAHLLLMNIRAVDLACRYAGDRFVLLLPEMEIAEANCLAEELQKSINHVAFRSGQGTTAIFQSIRVVADELVNTDSLNKILSNMNRRLDEMVDQVA